MQQQQDFPYGGPNGKQEIIFSSNQSKMDGDESSLDPGDELTNGEVLHCSFAGCNKEFTSRWSLTRHMRTHTGERPFKCSVCSKEFVQKCSLKRHEQTHSQEKQWICDFPNCGKRFKLKEYLDVHKRTHNKTEADAAPAEDEDQVIQDAADAAGALIDQLRQRLVRMSVRHHEQLFAYQQREYQLSMSLHECSQALEEALSLIKPTKAGMNETGIPSHLVEASIKFSIMTQQNNDANRMMPYVDPNSAPSLPR